MSAVHAPNRRITFCVRGLEVKDERLFKSFVRLVAHRTQHVWEASEGAAEVCVSPMPALQGGARHLLRVVQNTDGSGDQVEMPFHAEALEKCLNALGERVLAGRGTPIQVPAGSLPPLVRLVRWPAAPLLGSSQRMRMATVMTGKTLSVEDVQQRTSVPLDACIQFAHELLAAGCLVAAEAVPAPVVARPPVDAGLLSRIRSRLRRIHLHD